jgi:hypothetical protein
METGLSVCTTQPPKAYSAQAFFFRCDRCLERKTGLDFAGIGVAGLYMVNIGFFARFASEEESVLCCECLWADPIYLWLFGESGCSPVDMEAAL